MAPAERMLAFYLLRPIILIGVIACLCFSVGEGLRLRPFPVFVLIGSATPSPQLNPNAARDNLLGKYGPLDVPTRAQKRGKRQLFDYANTPSLSSREFTAQEVLLPRPRLMLDTVSLLVESRSAGRAPPALNS